jgi:hypothetical protein
VAGLLLGPVLRRVAADGVTVWVETDAPCRVDVLGRSATTFHVEGHHYALVDVRGLAPGTTTPYEVHLDGERVWPRADGMPPSTIRTLTDDGRLRLVLGSCQQRAPHEPPWTGTSGKDPRALGPDALLAVAQRMLTDEGERPDALLLLGDQVYADEPNPATTAALDRRRGRRPPEGWPEVSSFEEYTWLYADAWGDGLMRWLLSCVPAFMIFDDHDVIDDWNTSQVWHDRIEREPWWRGRIQGALMSYWIYQHLGEALFRQQEDDDLLAEVRAAGDGGPILRAFADRADAGTPSTVGHRWSYHHDLGPCRLIVLDSRNGRHLGAERSMLGDVEWEWFDDMARGGVDHVLIGTSVPWVLPRPLHDLEAWDEAVAEGAWGRRAAAVGERIRQAVDLEHWAAFGSSFEDLAAVVRSIAAGERGAAPATVLALSGDVHFGYVAELDLGGTSRVRQVVSSPLRHVSPLVELRVQRAAMARPAARLARALVRATRRPRPSFDWRIADGPWFHNQVAVLELDGRRATLRVERAVLDDDGRTPRLVTLLDRQL